MKLGRKKSDDSEGQGDQSKKQMGIEVAKVEVSDNVAKFLVSKGLGKKQWIVVREIPLLEIEHVEKFANELSVTWKGNAESFFTKEKTDLFGALVDQVNRMFEDQRKAKENKEKEEKAALRRSELLGVINASLGIIDQSFNVLIGLQEKHINWEQLEAYSNGLGANLTLTGQTMPTLTLDFSEISSAVKTQIPKEASNEAFNILKTAYGYFDGLSVDDEFKENHPNFQDAKAMILAYFMLNDLLLGKVVGDKENTEEISQLESALKNLAAETNFTINIDKLKDTINKVYVNSNNEMVIERSREIFKQQLKQQLKPTAKSLSPTKPVSKKEVTVEPAAATVIEPVVEPVIEPVSKSEVSVEPVVEPVAEPIIEPVTKSEVSAEPVSKSEKQQRAMQVSKVEVSDNIVKFSVAKGFPKKQWTVVKEIPILEIEHVEKFGNELSVTWKGATYTFFTKEKTDLFRPLVDQVNGILEGVNTEPAAPEAPIPPNSNSDAQT
jgi:hypothetical protein